MTPTDVSSSAPTTSDIYDEALLTSATPTSSSVSSETQGQRSDAPPRPPQGSVLGALSISLYESMSFSRSPSFERTRYIVSTCTFITIIYLRTLHCLFFGTGALSCAVLAKCLKHIIRQPRPYVARVDDEDDMNVYTANDPITAPPPSVSTSSSPRARVTGSNTPKATSSTTTAAGDLTSGTAGMTLSTTTCTDLDDDTLLMQAQLEAWETETVSMTEPLVDEENGPSSLSKSEIHNIVRSPSPTLTLAPATSLQQQFVDNDNAEQKAMLSQSKVPTSSSTTTTTSSTTEATTATTTTATRPKIKRLRLQNRHRRKILLRVDYGMPSSHAQLVAFFVCYISLQLILTMEPDQGAFGQWFLILLLQLYAWSAVWSRVRLGRHTVAQVLVGAAIGAVYGIVWFTLWCWKVEAMIQHWQWMDRYGVIQVRKMWRQLEMEGARLDGRGMMFQPYHHYHHHRHPHMPMGL
ncbi:hypothetical protein BGW42_003654 [Actinomortierella wolfii]|nr:hypothetical protein BGW42_003654 [Actinomortierella wolfii]